MTPDLSTTNMWLAAIVTITLGELVALLVIIGFGVRLYQEARRLDAEDAIRPE